MHRGFGDFFGKVNVQVSMVCTIMMVVASVLVGGIALKLSERAIVTAYRFTSDKVSADVMININDDITDALNSSSDMESREYALLNEQFRSIRKREGIDNLILVKKNENGENVYAVDGHEVAEQPYMTGTPVMKGLSDAIDGLYNESYYINEESCFINTDHGYKFYAIYPISRDKKNIKGVVCVEMDASKCRQSIIFGMVLALILMLVFILIIAVICGVMFKKISNPFYQDLTNTDALTNLKNKNSFTTDMHNIEAMRSKDKYGIMVIDLNGLKHINDTRGHNIGDKFIQDSAVVIRRTMFAKNQVAYRTGGDEFAIILKDMTKEEIEEILVKFEENIAKSNKDNYIKLSMSVGYALYDKEEDRNFYDTYQRADDMMYEVKREFYRKKAEKEAENIRSATQN